MSLFSENIFSLVLFILSSCLSLSLVLSYLFFFSSCLYFQVTTLSCICLTISSCLSSSLSLVLSYLFSFLRVSIFREHLCFALFMIKVKSASLYLCGSFCLTLFLFFKSLFSENIYVLYFLTISSSFFSSLSLVLSSSVSFLNFSIFREHLFLYWPFLLNRYL